MGTGADALDSGAGDNTLATHAGGAGAVQRLPATAFRVLLPMGQAACPRWAGVTQSLGSVCPDGPPWVISRAWGLAWGGGGICRGEVGGGLAELLSVVEGRHGWARNSWAVTPGRSACYTKGQAAGTACGSPASAPVPGMQQAPNTCMQSE